MNDKFFFCFFFVLFYTIKYKRITLNLKVFIEKKFKETLNIKGLPLMQNCF